MFLKEKYLNPIINFLKKFGDVDVIRLKEQARKKNMIKVKVKDYRFYFIYNKNGWRLIAIGE